MKPDANNPPQIIARQLLAQGKFLTLQRIDWLDDLGQPRQWESADRVGCVNAVYIICTLVPTGRLLFIGQYRPPVGGFIWEFPAGLIDADETPAQAAVRELKEETGYSGRVVASYPPSYSSPGMSGEAVHVVKMEIHEDEPANRDPQAAPQEGERIEVRLVKQADAGMFVKEKSAIGQAVDSRVIAYLLGAGLMPPEQ